MTAPKLTPIGRAGQQSLFDLTDRRDRQAREGNSRKMRRSTDEDIRDVMAEERSRGRRRIPTAPIARRTWRKKLEQCRKVLSGDERGFSPSAPSILTATQSTSKEIIDERQAHSDQTRT